MVLSLVPAELARASGTDVTLEVWVNMWHVWQFFAGLMPEGRQALNDAGSFIRKHIKLEHVATS